MDYLSMAIQDLIHNLSGWLVIKKKFVIMLLLILAMGNKYLLDEELYKERYSIERTNAWMDSFRSILNRFDITVSI